MLRLDLAHIASRQCVSVKDAVHAAVQPAGKAALAEVVCASV